MLATMAVPRWRSPQRRWQFFASQFDIPMVTEVERALLRVRPTRGPRGV